MLAISLLCVILTCTFFIAGHEPAHAPSAGTEGEDTDTGVKGSMRGQRRNGVEKSYSSSDLGLHILVPSHDGHVYVIDGKKRCAERIDVGEHIYSVPLADDVTGDGYLDIVLGTMNGQVQSEYHSDTHVH